MGSGGLIVKSLVLWLGRLSGLVGVLLLAVAVGARASDMFWLGGLPVGSMLNLGAATMVLACLCYLVVVVEYPASDH